MVLGALVGTRWHTTVYLDRRLIPIMQKLVIRDGGVVSRGGRDIGMLFDDEKSHKVMICLERKYASRSEIKRSKRLTPKSTDLIKIPYEPSQGA